MFLQILPWLLSALLVIVLVMTVVNLIAEPVYYYFKNKYSPPNPWVKNCKTYDKNKNIKKEIK